MSLLKPAAYAASPAPGGQMELYELIKEELGNLTFFDSAGRVIDALTQDELAEELSERLFKRGFRKNF